MTDKKPTRLRRKGQEKPIPRHPRNSATRNPLTKLTPGQTRFMEHLLAGKSVPEAYDAAGLCPTAARKALQRVDFQIVLEQQREALRETLGVERERNLLEYCRVAFANAADFFESTPSGAMRVKPVEEWTPGMRAAVASIDVLEEFAIDHRTGEKTLEGYTKKIRFHDKHKALDALNKMLGFDAAPKAPVGPDGKPVTPQIAGYIVVPAKDALPKPDASNVIEGHLEQVRGKNG